MSRATSAAKLRKSCSRATKSVSQLISTIAAARPSARALDHDDALGGDAGGLLVGLGEALLAHVLGRRIQVAAGLDEGLLALHHSGARALPQLVDGFGGDAHDSSVIGSIAGVISRPGPG